MLKIKLFDDCKYPLSFQGVDFPVIVSARKCREGFKVKGSEIINAGSDMNVSPYSIYIILPHECEVVEE